MDKWEYLSRIISLGELDTSLNHLGQDGWELVAFARLTNEYVYIFKRKLGDEACDCHRTAISINTTSTDPEELTRQIRDALDERNTA